MLARLYFQMGEEEKSYQLLMELLGDRLMDPQVAEGVADTLIVSGESERAVRLLKRVLPSFPKNSSLKVGK